MENKTIILVGVFVLVYLPVLLIFYFLAPPGSSAYSFPILLGDSADYAVLAENILKYKVFTLDTNFPFQPNQIYVPGYPLFIALILSVFKSYYAVSIVQIFLAAITAFLIFKIGKQIISPNAGFVAALLYAINPSTLFYSTVVMSDILFSFLLMLIVYLMFFSDSRRDYLLMLDSGLLLGFAALVRPLGLFLLPLLLVFYFVFKRKIIMPKKVFLLMFVFLAAFSAILTPWVIRNKISSGAWGVSSIGGFNLFHWNAPLFLSFKYNQDLLEARSSLYKEAGGLDEEAAKRLENSGKLKDIALKYIFQDPWGYLKFHLGKILQFLGGNNTKNFYVNTIGILWHKPNPFPHSALIDLVLKKEIGLSLAWLKSQLIFNFEYLVWLVILILSFMATTFREYRRHALFFASIILYLAVLTGPVAHVRYRLPAEPFMFLSALMGFQGFRERTFLFRRRPGEHLRR